MVHFNGDEVVSKKRPIEFDNSSRSSTSDESTRHRSKRKDKKNGKKSSSNGTDAFISNRHLNAFQSRRDSLGKAARDPRDEPPAKKAKKLPGQDTPRTASPPPVIESDGLSRPSKIHNSRHTPASQTNLVRPRNATATQRKRGGGQGASGEDARRCAHHPRVRGRGP